MKTEREKELEALLSELIKGVNNHQTEDNENYAGNEIGLKLNSRLRKAGFEDIIINMNYPITTKYNHETDITEVYDMNCGTGALVLTIEESSKKFKKDTLEDMEKLAYRISEWYEEELAEYFGWS